ncbi:BTAD domain-containing putative transcriptional regulator [Gemmatimonadota bacterium]
MIPQITLLSPPGEGALIELEVFGSLNLRAPEGFDAQRVLRQPKRAAFLVYLALHSAGGYVRRDTLLGVFWPEADRKRARGSLRQALRFLRTSLGDDVLVNQGGEEVGVSPDALSCDAIRFENLVEDGDPAAALELYRGDLLEGFFLDGAHEFDEWLESRRTALKDKAAGAAWSMAEGLAQESRTADAAFWGKRALGLSPFDEPHVQRLMYLLDQVGDRAGALRAYRGLSEWLDREYGAEPSPETQDLAEHVRERTEAHNGTEWAEPLTRRVRDERRSDQGRRVADLPFSGPDRRSGVERRSGGDRRSGQERRDTSDS